MLLVSCYNIAYGLSTALFPSQVTVLTKRSFVATTETPELAAAAVGWMYAVSGASSACVAALFAVLSHRYLAARRWSLCIGSIGFLIPSLRLAALPGETPLLPSAELFALFISYGTGVAAWQGSCMALVGDLFKGDAAEHRGAFAHLKLTSGAATSIGFVIFSGIAVQAAAVVTLCANVAGFIAMLALVLSEARQLRFHQAQPILKEYGGSASCSSSPVHVHVGESTL